MISKKQEAFINYYILSHNSADAARKAGYSVRTARTQGSFLLTKQDIKAAVETKEAAIKAELKLDKRAVIALLWKEARTAARAGDRINASVAIAKIEGWNKDGPAQVVSIYELLKDEIPGRASPRKDAYIKLDKPETSPAEGLTPPVAGV